MCKINSAEFSKNLHFSAEFINCTWGFIWMKLCASSAFPNSQYYLEYFFLKSENYPAYKAGI